MRRLMLIVASFILLSGLANAQVPELQKEWGWAQWNHRNLLMCVWHPEIVAADSALAYCSGEPARRLYESLDYIIFAQFRYDDNGAPYFEKYSPPSASYGDYHIDCYYRPRNFYYCVFRPREMGIKWWELSHHMLHLHMSHHAGRRQAARHYLIHSASRT
jgi:hypothetical protein